MTADRIGPFMLVQDDSNHWYVIPTATLGRWTAWLDSEAAQLGDVPDYAERVGGSPAARPVHGVQDRMSDQHRTSEQRISQMNNKQRLHLSKLMLERFRGITAFAQAVVMGKARWEAFSGDDDRGEVCVGGLRYATRLEDGVPIIDGPLLAALNKITEHFHRV